MLLHCCLIVMIGQSVAVRMRMSKSTRMRVSHDLLEVAICEECIKKKDC
jgi:hypothetical protein